MKGFCSSQSSRVEASLRANSCEQFLDLYFRLHFNIILKILKCDFVEETRVGERFCL